MSGARDGAYDEFLDAIEDDDAYSLTCPDGHGSLPPQRICPECGSRDLTRTALPATGEIATYTTVAVPAPRFSDASPYVTAIADFGPVHITGQLRGIESAAVEIGQQVTMSVEATESTDDRVVVFRPASIPGQ